MNLVRDFSAARWGLRSAKLATFSGRRRHASARSAKVAHEIHLGGQTTPKNSRPAGTQTGNPSVQ